MKIIISVLMLLSISAFAQTDSLKVKSEGAVETLVKKTKKDRKKKAEICHECGKPEVQCDCKGEEHKKSE